MLRIFLDYASSTPIAGKVLEAMKPWQEDNFSNPSALYNEALQAKEAVNSAREKIARVLNAQKNEIIFTSGGTEGNNLALLGLFQKYKTENFTPHIITCQTEHSSILEVCKEIERRGGEVTYLPVSPDGLISVKDIEESIRPETILISISFANNEIGIIQPIKEISKIIKNYREKNKGKNKQENEWKNKIAFPYFHTDACQAPLFLSLDLLKLGVDMMTLDGIKMYGPRGMGFLYIRSGIEINPILFGGGQERGLRSGTENTAGIVGLATALELAQKNKEKESVKLSEIRDYAISKILKTFSTAELNGSHTERLPNNINICFPGLDAEFAVISLDIAGISASYSSSCQTLKEDSSSYVISALGKKDCAESSLRFTLGRDTKKIDIDMLINALQKIIK